MHHVFLYVNFSEGRLLLYTSVSLYRKITFIIIIIITITDYCVTLGILHSMSSSQIYYATV